MAETSQSFKKKTFVQEFERVPPCYKEVEKVLNQVKACKGNFKTIMSNSRLRGAVFKKVYSLVANVLKHRHILEKVIDETELLTKVPFLRKEFAGILIYEVIFGKGLPGSSRPVLAIRKHEKEIREAYDIVKKDVNFSVTNFPSLPRYARVNTIATSVSAVLEDLRNNGVQQVHYDKNTSLDGYMNLVKNLQVGYFLIDFHFKDLLVFASESNLPSWHLHQKGHIFIQDKSSYIPVHALDPIPGCTVLDACAAPGMKTLHIAASMKNEGKIYAYERDKQRFETLKTTLDFGNVEICEADCVDFYLVNTNDPKFRSLEYVLVDPSCSGSGMVSRMDSVTDTEDSKNEHRLQKLAGFQILLLKHALLFPSVKRVVYSTCSVSELENEFVVHEVLNKFGNIFKLVSVMPDWPIRGSDNFEYGNLCLRAYPNESLTNGFFVAMFERLEYDQYGNCPLYDNLNSDTQWAKKNKKKCHNDNFEIPNLKQNKDECFDSYTEDKNFDNFDADINQNLSNFNETAMDVKRENDVEEHAVRKKHKKKKLHSEDQEKVSIKNVDNVTENVMELNIENDAESNTEKKKHKKKRHHDKNQDTILEENTDNAIEHFNEIKVENVPEENTLKKKHKKKKFHPKDGDIVLEENFNDVSENTVELKVENELECNTMKKKHKRKRHRSEDQEINFNEINENVMEVKVENDMELEKKAQNKRVKGIKSIADEAVDGPSDCVLTKKHKKKRHNDVIESNICNYVVDFKVKRKKSKCHISSEHENEAKGFQETSKSVCVDSNTNTNSCLEIPSEFDLQFDETQIKKKHKKKCKDKKNKEE